MFWWMLFVHVDNNIMILSVRGICMRGVKKTNRQKMAMLSNVFLIQMC